MPTRTDEIPVSLENGQQVFIKTTLLGEELMDVAAIERVLSFSAVADSIEGIARGLMNTLDKVRPQKAKIEFGIEVAMKEGQLTALLVQGTATANLKITLEWERKDSPRT